MIKKNLVVSCTFLIGLAVSSCTHLPLGFGDVIISENCSADTAYFVNEAFPIIQSNCAKSGCHDAITHEEGINLSSWDDIYYGETVKPGNADDSKMIKVLYESGEEKMPPDNDLTETQIDILKLWINQGALNNECLDGNCDTINVHYASSIVPLLNTYCVGCHSGTSPSGDVNLTSHTEVAIYAADGRLYGAVNHEAGFVSMPPGTHLSDCKIDVIRIWIENGFPND